VEEGAGREEYPRFRKSIINIPNLILVYFNPLFRDRVTLCANTFAHYRQFAAYSALKKN
jgi:hypothetical protein